MKIRILTFLFGSLILFTNCDEDCDSVFHSCDSGPFYGDVNVRVTINDENPEVEIVLFRGRIEKQDMVIHEYVIENSTIYSLEAGVYYSGTAFYKDGIKEMLAINGKNLSTSTDDCDCKYADNMSLNLKLAK
ncbi:MAG: hypothetical protein ACJA08_001471 [Cyclobacteriaceae bacterium]|jgi:hypothetical protein